jgi:3-dehydroquinate synthetase/predicted NBD/HSP70 family sugar kinase
MNGFPVALGNGDEVIAFDIGGTSFRSALLTREGRLRSVQRVPSINFRSVPGRSAADILDTVAAYIAQTARELSRGSASRDDPAVAVSMGAALNAHTGRLLGSGPILGAGSTSFDLENAIRRYLPRSPVTVVNDVTASLVAHSCLPAFRHCRKLALVTVSTGIASRVLNCSVPHVPVDPGLGIQGEIGHHPVPFFLDGRPLSLPCDCGGMDHVSAFSSGLGIQRVLEHLPEIFPAEFRNSLLHQPNGTASTSLAILAGALAESDPLAAKVLHAVTRPIAEAIKWHFMLDPEIDKLVLTGGVCFVLHQFYLAAILEHLSASGYYPVTAGSRAYWASRVDMGPLSDDAGLLGAAFIAREAPCLHRRETLSAGPPYRVWREHAIDFSIHLAEGTLRDGTFPEYLLDPFDRIILVIDGRVNEIYGEAIRLMLAGSRRGVETIPVSITEKQKDMGAIANLASSFEDLRVRRRKDLVVAAGGGITLDLAGLATNLFRRGIPCLRLPTTLLAEIDAGIGIKNAVNFRQSKSRLGTFSAPYAVVVDPAFLLSLPDRQIRNGLSEALKIALVADRQLFELIESSAAHLLRTRLQCSQGSELIRRSIRAMLLELAPNLHERTLDRLPDYGHTFSPIFEFVLSDLEHGEAVALDMALDAALALLLGSLDRADAHRILLTQHALGLPIVRDEICVDILARGVREAKRHRGGQLRMPLLSGIGEARFVDELTDTQLADALAFVRSWTGRGACEVAQSA